MLFFFFFGTIIRDVHLLCYIGVLFIHLFQLLKNELGNFVKYFTVL